MIDKSLEKKNKKLKKIVFNDLREDFFAKSDTDYVAFRSFIQIRSETLERGQKCARLDPAGHFRERRDQIIFKLKKNRAKIEDTFVLNAVLTLLVCEGLAHSARRKIKKNIVINLV